MKLQLAMEEFAAEREEKARLEGGLKKQIELVKNFFANGTPIKIISKSTNLSEEEVVKILADDMPKNPEV